MRILQVISRLPNSFDLTYTLGQRIALTAFGSLTQVMRMAPTPREGLRLLGDCLQLLTSMVLYRFSGSRREAGAFSVSIDYPLDADSMEIFLMATVSTIDKEQSQTSGRPGNISAIQFSELSEKARQAYCERFDVGASGGHPANSVLLPTAILDRDNPTADPETYAVISRE